MRDFVIMTDSCCDLTDEMARDLGVAVVPLSLQMGGQTYRNWLDGRASPSRTFTAASGPERPPPPPPSAWGSFKSRCGRSFPRERTFCI